MAEFINTIDALGEEAVVDGLIQRTLGEFRDNVITSVGQYAFYACKALSLVDFPSVATVAADAFNGCGTLKALSLRSETLCPLANVSALNGTPIKSGTGYIYVPRALVDSYKGATNWSTYANQVVALEDYTDDGTITGTLYAAFAVRYALSNVSSSNTSNVASRTYTTTLTPADGNDTPNPSIIMGGIDITKDVYDPDTGVVYIPNVTGDIIIKAGMPTFTITGKQSTWYHFTILCNAPSNSGTVKVSLEGTDAVNVGASGSIGAGSSLYFGDNSGDVSNTSYSGVGPSTPTTFVNENGLITASVSGNVGVIYTPYIKYILCIPVATLPAIFTITNLSVTVNGVPQDIIKYGGFFVNETYEVI